MFCAALGTNPAAAAGLYNFNYFLSQPHPFAQPGYPPAVAPARPAAPASLRYVPARQPAPPSAPAAGTPVKTPAAVEMAETGQESFLDGFYYSVNLVGGYSTIHDPELTNITNLEVRRDEDWVGGNSGSIGYDWDRKFGVPVRTELEPFIRYRFDLDYRGNSGGFLQGYTNEVASFGAMVNGYYDIDFEFWNFKPYVGAGIGMVRHWSQAVRTNTFNNARSSQDARTNQLAWNVMGGLNYHWKPNWLFRIEGRYQDLGDVENGPFADNDTITAHYTTTDLVLGVIYRH